jgi:peroxiredoxin
MGLSNHKSVVSTFQNSLKQIAFKTVYHDQIEIFDYDRLFADQRVIILSTPTLFFPESIEHLNQYKAQYKNFISNRIDNICVVNSFNPLIAGIADSMFNPIIGLPDIDMKFVSALALEIKSSKTINFLSRRWEYVIIINNGQLEKIWQNPFPETITLRQYRYGYESGTYHSLWELHGKIQEMGSIHYRKLNPGVVLDYLKTSVDV